MANILIEQSTMQGIADAIRALDGNPATMTPAQMIERLKVYHSLLPLPGVFTVNSSGKKIQFSKGNLFWDGSKPQLEEHQYDYPTSWNANHVGHFKYSSTVAEAIADDDSYPSGDTLFAADGGVFPGFTVLSDPEWYYLIDHALAKNSSGDNTITIAGKNCVVLKPDGFTGTVADSYTAAEWVEGEKSGLVALPFSGSRRGTDFYGLGFNSYHWSSTPPDRTIATAATFYPDQAYVSIIQVRYLGYSVRLVKVVD